MKWVKAKKHQLQAAKKAVSKGAQAVVTLKTSITGHAPEEKTFVLKDGRKLRTLYELIDELETMPDALFHEFVNGNKNDFAAWIEGVFNEKSLADELRKLQSRFDHQRAILKHLVRELRKR
ncbi:hypothetical protein HY492_02385 [Candidatus Woesearchaeota archaeon]|nr:hypothetical protein [Candidatus Woesearchaeota archaeon]